MTAIAVPTPALKLLGFIASYEAPHGYDTVYGNKMSRIPKRLSAMTLDEAISNSPWRTCGIWQHHEIHRPKGEAPRPRFSLPYPRRHPQRGAFS